MISSDVKNKKEFRSFLVCFPVCCSKELPPHYFAGILHASKKEVTAHFKKMLADKIMLYELEALALSEGKVPAA